MFSAAFVYDLSFRKRKKLLFFLTPSEYLDYSREDHMFCTTNTFRRKSHCLLLRQRRGTVIVLSAILMTVLIGMVAFSIDCGMIVAARTQLQASADAGARAGASSLRNGPTSAIVSAEQFAEANNVIGGQVSIIADEDVELGRWNKTTKTFTPLSGAEKVNANAVRVTCQLKKSRGNSLTLFFAPIFGIFSSDVSAQAIAINSPILCGPFVGLEGVKINGSYTDSYNSDDGSYGNGLIGKQGHVCSNESIELKGSKTIINGDAHPGSGRTVSGEGFATGSITPLESKLFKPAIDDSSASKENSNGSLPGSVFDKKGRFELSSKQSYIMPPGTYYFSSFKLGSQSALTINSKVTIYCTGDFDGSGGTIANTTEVPAHCQIFVSGSSVKISGDASFYGVVYAPNADLKRNGNSDFFGVAVGRTLESSGNGGLHYDESLGYLDGVPSITQLVQ